MTTRPKPQRLRGVTKQDPQQGDPNENLEGFYQQVYLPLVRRVTWKHRLPREDARDIVQDAFVLALSRLEWTGNPKAWLIQVVDHLALNHRRKVVRRSTLSERWGYREPVKTRAGEDFDDSAD